MLTPGKVDLSVRRGQTFRYKFEFFEPDGVTPVQMLDWKALMHIRLKAGDADLLHELSTEDGSIILDPANGDILLYISDEDTETFEWKAGVYDIKLFYPDGDDDFLAEGKFTVGSRVTVGEL